MQSIAIIGAGTMGAGIAASCIGAGLSVLLVDPNRDALTRAEARIRSYLERQADRGRLERESMPDLLAALEMSSELSSAAQAMILIEAVFEDLEVKRDLLRSVEAFVSVDCVIATNTSCLRVDEIATAVRHPERFLGLHYFSPAEVNPVVELVAARATSEKAARIAGDFLASTGKEALHCRDSNGFALNRFLCPYCNEAVRCLEEGIATAGQIDAVARSAFDLPLGPFEVMNLTHPRIMLHAEQSLAVFGNFYKPADLLRETGEAGRLWEILDDCGPLPEDRAAVVADRLKGAVLLAGGDVITEGVVDAGSLDEGARKALRFGKPPTALRQELGDREASRVIAEIRRRYAQ